MKNKSTFTIPGGGNKDRGLTKVHLKPGFSQQYIHDMILSQKGVKLSQTVTDAEEEAMFNRIWNENK